MATPVSSDDPRDWAVLVDLLEKVMAEDDLLPQVAAGVRTLIQEVAALPVADITGHTRALLTAAARALAGRRGPTEAELAFVEELAITRADQGIPIEGVLGAIQVSERAIWTRARELAEQEGVSAWVLLDARELYDDWAGAVRARLIRAHRTASARRGGARRDRNVEIMRRLLAGGSAATLAAAEAGLSGDDLWVLVARGGDVVSMGELRRSLDEKTASLTAVVDATLVAVAHSPVGGSLAQHSWTAGMPRVSAGGVADRPVVGMAGPVGAEEIGPAYRLAVSAVPAAEAIGRSGLIHAAEVAGLVALLSRSDLATALVNRHRAARRELGSSVVPVARAVRAWLEADRDTAAAARALFVHANTVRNRVQRFTGVTGIDPLSTFGALDAWWLCLAWLGDDG